MTDKPAKKEAVFGCDSNDPKPRMAKKTKGEDFQVSPMDGLNPAPDADGKSVQSVRHVGGSVD